MPALAPLPPRPDAAFDPVTHRGRVGHFAGVLDEVRWGYYRGWLHGQVRRALVRKRWFEVLVHTDTHALLVHLQDDGLTGHGRVAVVDLQDGARLAWGRDEGAPLRTMVVGFMAAEGTEAFLHAPTLDIALPRREGATAWHLRIDGAGVHADLTLDTAGAPVPTLVVGEAPPPLAHRPGLTQHHPTLAVDGTLVAGGRPVSLRGASAHVTYTNAFLPPQVSCRRMVADGVAEDGTPVALVLSDGDLHGTTCESTLWWDGQPLRLPAVHVLADGEGRDVSWRLLSADGTLDLVLHPRARHDAHTTARLGWLRHDHTHLHGTLSGRIPGPDGRPTPLSGLRAHGVARTLRG